MNVCQGKERICQLHLAINSLSACQGYLVAHNVLQALKLE